jgi:hypothetical protein
MDRTEPAEKGGRTFPLNWKIRSLIPKTEFEENYHATFGIVGRAPRVELDGSLECSQACQHVGKGQSQTHTFQNQSRNLNRQRWQRRGY